MRQVIPQLPDQRAQLLSSTSLLSVLDEIDEYLVHQIALWKIIYPDPRQIFFALETTPPQNCRVVIVGQDPYHHPWQAHGLSFSVPETAPIPPSLHNIFKEIADDCGQLCHHGNLTKRAKQGVLLLNSSLTVEHHKPWSHASLWWNKYTDSIIQIISDYQNHCVFMLRGAHAQSKKHLIDTTKHLVMEAPHPSPLSAYRGFFGCRHFSRCNTYLSNHQLQIIDRSIPALFSN